jgi:hypothetical protein
MDFPNSSFLNGHPNQLSGVVAKTRLYVHFGITSGLPVTREQAGSVSLSASQFIRLSRPAPAARRCNLLRSKNTPRAITATTRLELPMAIKGLPWTSTRSATFPASMVPIESSIAKKIAGLRVAACKACNGVKPTATNRSSSSWRHQPGWPLYFPRMHSSRCLLASECVRRKSGRRFR